LSVLVPMLCPWCGADVAESDGEDPDETPDPGDVSVCFGCLRIGIFVDAGGALALRRAEPDEQAELRRQPQIATMIAQARRDPLRQVRGPDDAHRHTDRWRDELLLRKPVR
jgi:hypothetical protein